MATIVITPEMQRANAEALLGKDPGKFRDPGQRWTVKRYAEIQRLLKQAEADKPVTILNLNPFPLKINGGVYFPEEIAPCPPGKPYSVHVIRDTRWGHKDLGCDAQNMMQMEPVRAIPLVLVAENIREYVQQDGGFGGVLCYVGDHDPASIKKGGVIRVPEVAYSDTGEFYVGVRERDFHETLTAIRKKRNSSILQRLQSANAWYENDSQRMNVNDTHRDLARLAVEEGLIPESPRWVMRPTPSPKSSPTHAPSRATTPKTGAILCPTAAKSSTCPSLQKREDRLRFSGNGPPDSARVEIGKPDQGRARSGKGREMSDGITPRTPIQQATQEAQAEKEAYLKRARRSRHVHECPDRWRSRRDHLQPAPRGPWRKANLGESLCPNFSMYSSMTTAQKRRPVTWLALRPSSKPKILQTGSQSELDTRPGKGRGYATCRTIPRDRT